MTIIRLTIAILLLAGIASANVGYKKADYKKIDTTDFATRAETLDGQFVAVTGKVCSINADGKSIHLFNSETRAIIEIDLSQLQKSQRRALILSPVRQISVFGKAELKNGVLIIGAHRVEFEQVSKGK